MYYDPLDLNDIRWNFEKFLIDHEGNPVRRFRLACCLKISIVIFDDTAKTLFIAQLTIFFRFRFLFSRFHSNTDPLALKNDIETLLAVAEASADNRADDVRSVDFAFE